MEAILVALIGIIELAATALIPALFAACELAIALLSLFAQLITWLVTSVLNRKARRAVRTTTVETTAAVEAKPQSAVPSDQGYQASPRFRLWRLWSRRIAIGCGVMTAVTFAVLLIVNFFFFDALAKFATRQAMSRTGMTLKFDRADGNLFTGDVRFGGLSLERADHPESNFRFEIDEVEASVRWRDLLRRDRRLESLSVRGVNGNFERVAVSDPVAKKPFVIEKLEIANAKVDLIDLTAKGGVARTTLAVDVLQVVDYDSRWAAFKVMFESTVHGQLDGHAFEITNGKDDAGYWSRWKADQVPVPLVATYLGGPFTVFTGGRAKVDVNSRWEKGSVIELRWQVVFADLQAEVPQNANPLLTKFAEPVVGYLNQHGRNLPLAFHVVIDEQAFRGRASLETVGLWKVVRESAARTVQEAVGGKLDVVAARARDAGQVAVEKGKREIDKAGAAGKKAVDRVKGFFDREKSDGGDDVRKDDGAK